MLSNVKTGNTVLQGQCNAGVSTSAEKGVYGLWSFWLNEKGIMNLLSIPQLEKDGYTIDYNYPISLGVVVDGVTILLKLRNREKVCNAFLV